MMSAKFRAVRPQRVNESLQTPEALGSVAADGQGLSKSQPIQLSSSSNHKRSLWSSTQCDHKSTPYHAGACLTGDRPQILTADRIYHRNLFFCYLTKKNEHLYTHTLYKINDFCESKSHWIWFDQGWLHLKFFKPISPLVEIWFCCTSVPGHQIVTNFCTCHDNTAVSSCS